MNINNTTKKSMRVQFVEGITLQLTNPKAIFFFMSIFPHFVDYSSNYIGEFLLLVVTYSSLVLVIHFIYANVAKKTRNWFASDTGSKIVNRAGGCTFICFGIGLVLASR
jgi:threonine/homoserine/homoserine lactone efflux protein